MVNKLGRADLHIHTTYSHDGLATPAEVVDRALELGLDAIAITDHDRIDGAIETVRLARSRIPVIVGEEISTRSGHVLGLFLSERVTPGLSLAETIRRIHHQGGIAIIAHPLWHLYLGVTPGGHRLGLELGGVNARTMRRMLAAPREAQADAVEIFNSSLHGRIPHREVVRLNRDLWHLSEIGSSDAHDARMIGASMTFFPGHTPRELRSAIEGGTTLAQGEFLSSRETIRLVGGAVGKNALRLITHSYQSVRR